jgi:hypothetical protein
MGAIFAEASWQQNYIAYSEGCRNIAIAPTTARQGSMVLTPVAVEKGTKAVIPVNFSACSERTLNNLRTNFVAEIP